MRLYAERGGGIVFINLVDKTKDQGQLGEAFDAALEAVANGAGRELSPYDRAEGEKNTPAKGEESDLAGSLRHVWFDFHHEVGKRRVTPRTPLSCILLSFSFSLVWFCFVWGVCSGGGGEG